MSAAPFTVATGTEVRAKRNSSGNQQQIACRCRRRVPAKVNARQRNILLHHDGGGRERGDYNGTKIICRWRHDEHKTSTASASDLSISVMQHQSETQINNSNSESIAAAQCVQCELFPRYLYYYFWFFWWRATLWRVCCKCGPAQHIQRINSIKMTVRRASSGWAHHHRHTLDTVVMSERPAYL